MHTRISAALVPLVCCGLASIASAQEFCVTCSGPAAKYRCLVGGNASYALRSSRGQLLCITELARIGQHASCSVGRTTLEVCEGEVRTVIFPDTPDTADAPVDGWQSQTSYADGTTAAAAGQREQQVPTEAPPQTLGSLTKKAVDASNEGLKKAGQAVSNTAKSAGNAVVKSWNCLTSLFSDC